MNEPTKPPPIVVNVQPKSPPVVWKKRRHPAKVGMLIAVVLWPVLAIGFTLALWGSYLSETELQGDRRRYVAGTYINYETSASLLLQLAAFWGSLSSTMLFGVAMIVLGVVWFATKPD